jgi:tripartite-type tricarboxylate transporter receptor subunit TctC
MRWLAALALLLGSAAAHAQNYPSAPIRFIVSFGPGSATDLLARQLAEPLSQAWGQPVVVDNRGGGDGIVASEAVAHAKPDGYTVLLTANTTHGSNPALHKTLPYDPLKDCAPVTLVGTTPLLALVNPDLPIRTAGELIAYAKAHPGKLNFSSGSASSRVAGEMFKSMAGIDMVNVTYRSNPQAIADLIAGQVQVMFCDSTTARPQVLAGKARAIGVTSLQRTSVDPDRPTIAEQGLPGYEMIAWNAVFLPAGTPAPIVAKLHGALDEIMRQPAVRARLAQNGMELAASTPEALGTFVVAEIAKWKRIVAEAKIEVE